MTPLELKEIVAAQDAIDESATEQGHEEPTGDSA